MEDKDKKDWSDFTKNLKNLHDKDSNISYENKNINLVKKIDLHGFSLEKANKTVENFINQSFDLGCNKLIVITGKGSRSKTYQDPYRSEKMSVLKYSVPEYILNNKILMGMINEIKDAKLEDGGGGAFYIFLKKRKSTK